MIFSPWRNKKQPWRSKKKKHLGDAGAVMLERRWITSGWSWSGFTWIRLDLWVHNVNFTYLHPTDIPTSLNISTYRNGDGGEVGVTPGWALHIFMRIYAYMHMRHNFHPYYPQLNIPTYRNGDGGKVDVTPGWTEIGLQHVIVVRTCSNIQSGKCCQIIIMTGIFILAYLKMLSNYNDDDYIYPFPLNIWIIMTMIMIFVLAYLFFSTFAVALTPVKLWQWCIKGRHPYKKRLL